MLLGQLVAIPGGRGIGGEHQLVGGIDTGIELGNVGIEGEVQYLREKNDAVEIDIAFGFEDIRQHSGSRGAVTFAEQVLRRIPASVFREELRDEIGEGLPVRVHTVEGFFAVFAAEAAEAGSGRIHKYKIAYV